MQYAAIEAIPDARFPFGQPLKLVKQHDRSPKRVFVLGVYASAVHAKWYSPKKKVFCKAFAVASEPVIFWNGENAAEIISQIEVPSEAGYLKPAEGKYNGPSGKTLDGLYLAPLGLSRSNAWLCDLVPHSFMNKKQEAAIQNRYIPLSKELHKKYDIRLQEASVPNISSKQNDKILRERIDEYRRDEILAEIEESQAKTIILLGDKPIKWFLSLSSDSKKTRLDEFDYGLPVPINFMNGKAYTVIPLAHVRQGGKLGSHNYKWKQRHDDWLTKVAPRIKIT